jgi:predicted dehydrogenase
MPDNSLSRRQLLTRSTTTALTTLTASALSAAGPRSAASERIRVGCVGVEGRAGFLLQAFAERKDVEVVAVADIDSRNLPGAVERVTRLNGKAPRAENDFRRLIDDSTIDVLVVGTPDHWHAIPTIMACQAGKDVYVEKPDGHNIQEGQRMVQAMRKHGRIVQMGTQSRSGAHFLSAIEFIRTGKLGKCLVAKAWESTRQSNIGRPADSEPPEGVDYDFWLGPAPKRPFNERRFKGTWRWFFDYGTGDLGNDGVHRLDVARWALSTAVEAQGGKPLEFPSKISASGGKWYFDDLQEWPDTLQVNYEYAGTPGCLLTYEMRIWSPYRMYGEPEGAVVFGDQAYIVIGNNRWRAYDTKDQVIAEGAGSNDGRSHIENFLSCVRTRQKPNADLDTVGHPSSMLCHAGNVSWRLGRTVTLDPTTEMFVTATGAADEEANRFRTRTEYRSPWQLPMV